MKISYVTIGNALDIHNWSGLEYYIAKTLEEQVGEVNYIGNLNVAKTVPMELKRIVYRVMGQRYDWVRDPLFAKQCSEQVKAVLKSDTDIIFSTGSVATALLESRQPKVIYSDATFAGLLNFYVSDYCEETIRKGNYLEQQALASARLAIYSSDWAAQSAIQYYGINPDKVEVVPFGANIEHSLGFSEIKDLVHRRSRKECNLLFLGVDWNRKGGDMAIQVAEELNRRGIKTNLHIAGIRKIPLASLPDFVVDHGFISKHSKEGRNRINSLMAKCHFLLLPTKAEAYGVVFCEANAFGLPAVATNVGGISTIIKNNINGMKFRLGDKKESYADYIASVFCDQKQYEQLALSSYNEYSARLNWQVAGKKILSLMQAL